MARLTSCCGKEDQKAGYWVGGTAAIPSPRGKQDSRHPEQAEASGGEPKKLESRDIEAMLLPISQMGKLRSKDTHTP